jgi:hypothetical protein
MRLQCDCSVINLETTQLYRQKVSTRGQLQAKEQTAELKNEEHMALYELSTSSPLLSKSKV